MNMTYINVSRKYVETDTETALRGGLRDERSIKSHHIYVPNGLRPPFSHSIIHIPAVSSFTPSSPACPVGVQFLPRMRGGSAVLSFMTTYCWPSGANLLAQKQHMYFFWCLCDYCALVFLCYSESTN